MHNGMSRLKRFAAALIVTMSQSTLAHAWPRLSGGNSPECSQSFELAKAAFRSEQWSAFYEPPPPADFDATISVLDRASLEADTAFERIPPLEDNTTDRVYWQIKPQLGKRFAIVIRRFGWRGDYYTLYSIDDSATPDAFAGEALVENLSTLAGKRAFEPIIGGYDIPPLILTHKSSGSSWVIVLDANFRTLGSWRVFTTGTDGTLQRCVISFVPNVGQAVFLLPKDAQRFAALLDEALGPGLNEGTLHPTARIRGGVNHLWETILLRPWALGNPYNTREEVEAGLQTWSSGNAKRRALHARIVRQYPRAERALADHYRMTFQMPAADARTMAAFTTDIVFRRYFVCPSTFATPSLAQSPWNQLSHR
jgi:hypothetical protein